VDSENAVLRRLLLGEDIDPGEPCDSRRAAVIAPRGTPERKDGDLRLLLKAGLVKAGDLLVHEQPRKGQIHLGTIQADGWIEVEDGRSYATPSGALKARARSRDQRLGLLVARALEAQARRTARQTAPTNSLPPGPDRGAASAHPPPTAPIKPLTARSWAGSAHRGVQQRRRPNHDSHGNAPATGQR